MSAPPHRLFTILGCEAKDVTYFAEQKKILWSPTSPIPVHTMTLES